MSGRSTAPARVLPAEQVVPGTPAPAPARTLRLVPRSRIPAARTPFVLLVVGLLVAWLLTLLALNTALAQMSFHAYDLAEDNRDLLVREQTLHQQVQDRTSPAALAAAALAQGMVPGEQPAFLDLGTGTVLGSAAEAEAPPPPDPAESTDPAGSTDPAVTDPDASDPDVTVADSDEPTGTDEGTG